HGAASCLGRAAAGAAAADVRLVAGGAPELNAGHLTCRIAKNHAPVRKNLTRGVKIGFLPA
ncbi:hypothetical protein, partial [Endobacter medicaginis]|uniref:hypothetical protein n=1 Tax=Endobacter medicaginis TaxID=1181271 RepID=UPI001C3FFF98